MNTNKNYLFIQRIMSFNKLIYLSLYTFIFVISFYTTFCAEKDLYKILGVKRDASTTEIKRKYRQLSRQYHPDKNKSKEAAEKYVEINEAYEVLSDNKKRRLYDRGGMDAVNKNTQMEDAGGDPFDIFNIFGGGRRRHHRDNRDEDLRIKIRATLKDLYLGKEYEFIYTRYGMCPHCRGSGADSPDDVTTCDKCNGQGMIVERKQIGPGFFQQFQTNCPKCGGKGKMVKKECHVCKGNKIMKGLEELSVFIEKGMENGAEIKFDDYGEERRDKDPGNLIFIVQELPHKVFKREKDNLRMKMKISLKDALVGFTKEIKHLDGHIVTISKKTVTQPGEIIKITGEGMPIHQRGGNGDLLVEMEIEIPQTLTKEQKEKLEVFFRKRSYW